MLPVRRVDSLNLTNSDRLHLPWRIPLRYTRQDHPTQNAARRYDFSHRMQQGGCPVNASHPLPSVGQPLHRVPRQSKHPAERAADTGGGDADEDTSAFSWKAAGSRLRKPTRRFHTSENHTYSSQVESSSESVCWPAKKNKQLLLKKKHAYTTYNHRWHIVHASGVCHYIKGHTNEIQRECPPSD